MINVIFRVVVTSERRERDGAGQKCRFLKVMLSFLHWDMGAEDYKCTQFLYLYYKYYFVAIKYFIRTIFLKC